MPARSTEVVELYSTDGDSTDGQRNMDVSGSFHLNDSAWYLRQPVSSNDGSLRMGSSEKRDAKLVLYSKLIISFFLLLVTVMSAVGTYAIFRKTEENSFSKQFEDYAHEIVQVSTAKSQNIFAMVVNMATTISSYAVETNKTWPFVTVPHFEQRGRQLLELSGARYLSLNVLVNDEEKFAWQDYSIANQGWVQQGLDFQGNGSRAAPITPYVYKERDGFVVPDQGPADPYYAVTWQIAPAPEIPTLVNFNAKSNDLGQIVDRIEAVHGELMSAIIIENKNDAADQISRPQSFLVEPIYDKVLLNREEEEDKVLVGYLNALLPWDNYFRNIIPEGTKPIHLVLKNTCGQLLTFKIVGPNVVLLSANADVHDPSFDHLEVAEHFQLYDDGTASSDDEGGDQATYCRYEYSVYPSAALHASYQTSTALLSSFGVVCIFFLTSAMFVLYDVLVTKRHQRVEQSAARSNALVGSLFPKQVRERLLLAQNNNGQTNYKSRAQQVHRYSNNNGRMQLENENSTERLTEEEMISHLERSKPIADLFPNATVMFADICGFTAWSSVREPAQVFTLLEQIYNSFDVIAKKRRIFKVETIGDCYVAAAGLPDPRDDHALAMSRFALECLVKMDMVVKRLEVQLGPDTAELGMRFGLHSGPVTAGVLRGEKSRFQLFGDTVNTASRIETTGEKNRVHISEATAKLLIAHGKESWVKKRDEVVTAKGKGDMKTYWLTSSSSSSAGGSRSLTSRPFGAHHQECGLNAASVHNCSSAIEMATDKMTERKRRFVAWNADVLSGLLKRIMAMREDDQVKQWPVDEHLINISGAQGATVLDEVKDIMQLPQQDIAYKRDPESIAIDPSIQTQLRDYITVIASMYRDNPFHNFEHASHVTQSVTKLLSRIVAVDDIDNTDLQYKKKDNSQLHEYTSYGITSDAITQFACAFSALIHDVDHTGVPNATLIREESEIAEAYDNKSVAEQNSVDLSWALLMEEQFEDLRKLIYTTQEELTRFRQLVVNAVMATDIADKELAQARRDRWDKAFEQVVQQESAVPPSLSSPSSPSSLLSTTIVESSNRKATIVIEYLMQASDVSHTMQHWHVYLKWNEKLFHEMYLAFREGREDKDPSETWYQGELEFYDFYVMPLAKKLKECGVFGVSSDEYLNYAQANRQEWEIKGRKIVENYVATFKR